jgi:hypothetical protein
MKKYRLSQLIRIPSAWYSFCLHHSLLDIRYSLRAANSVLTACIATIRNVRGANNDYGPLTPPINAESSVSCVMQDASTAATPR